jgi:hypothetical protein
MIGLLLSGCASPVLIQKNDLPTQQAVSQILTKLNIGFDNKIEADIVQKELYDFCYFLEHYYGQDKWQAFYSLVVEQGKSPEASAIEVYGKSLYHLGGELIHRALQDQSAKDLQPKTTLFGVFKIVMDDAAQFEADYPYILYSIKKYETDLRAELITTEAQRQKLVETIQMIEDKLIPVHLISTKAAIDQVFQSPWSTAETSLGYWIKEPGKPGQLNASMAFKYSGLLSLNTVVHEMTHMLISLSRLDLSCIETIDPKDTKEILQQKMEPLRESFERAAGGLVLGEGLAEYMAGKHNLLQRYKIMDDVDATIRSYCAKHKLKPDVFALEKMLRTHDTDKRILAYQLAHSYTRYLIGIYGIEKIMELSENRGEEAAYVRILFESKQAHLRKWYRTLFE